MAPSPADGRPARRAGRPPGADGHRGPGGGERSAVAAPMPDDAPVTSATFPCSGGRVGHGLLSAPRGGVPPSWRGSCRHCARVRLSAVAGHRAGGGVLQVRQASTEGGGSRRPAPTASGAGPGRRVSAIPGGGVGQRCHRAVRRPRRRPAGQLTLRVGQTRPGGGSGGDGHGEPASGAATRSRPCGRPRRDLLEGPAVLEPRAAWVGRRAGRRWRRGAARRTRSGSALSAGGITAPSTAAGRS